MELSRLVMSALVSMRVSGRAWPGRLHEEQLLAEASTCWVLRSRVTGLPSLSTAVPGDSMPPALGVSRSSTCEWSEAAVLQLFVEQRYLGSCHMQSRSMLTVRDMVGLHSSKMVGPARK